MNFVLKRKYKIVFIDYILFFISYLIAMFMRFQFDFDEFSKYISPIILYPFIMIVIFKITGVYKSIWRFATLKELLPIFYSGFFGFLINFFIFELFSRYVTDFFILPFSVVSFASLLGVLLVSWSRIFWFSYSKKDKKAVNLSKKILIIGAGDAGVELLSEFERHPEAGIVLGFLDDDDSKIGRKIRNYEVLDKPENIMKYVENMEINEVIIAIPSANSDEVKNILDFIDKSKVRVKTLPGIFEILNNKVSLGFLRDVEISDLLGRKEIEVNLNEIESYIKGKNVLITGAGGSIGSEICRQVSALKPKILYVLGRGENSIFKINKELKNKFPNLMIEEIICDVTNEKRLYNIFKKYKFDIVFHAAAHKHVPLMEKNPSEAFMVNTLGTYNIARFSGEFNIERFIFISTDKAINPTSIMGTSKRLGEMLIRSISKDFDTKFGIVRFGNVLGSRGSVVPIFKEQIKNGGPVTVTHKDMKRYFMTIPEAVALVLQSGKYAEDGEVFILNMGEPVLIDSLARELIRLSGYVPDQDIKVVYTGIRPGEKLYEELFLETEEFLKTNNSRIFKLKANNMIDYDKINNFVEFLNMAIESNNFDLINAIIGKYVPDSKARVDNEISR
ncbi:polysaccharide biosynthesis protein [Oceanotoga sp. DSM 15011]|uniref:FlaA1/EpsC-like NDP-sugar epimerase n=1 Tax=Oceanotoga teriensis TaxID=515440 RepID=A0AA45C612_9BACT|nr:MULTISPECIES: nucleoside-diphosphate sugar epimerase/dehydratase [Oceanotoga]PWJ90549.1 FlaA1/EpsC-like NDP-sugar epimerase [Oceanotoga teriensis]UYO99793.1 polysaccharide biosynthesis protein [Oceanotoga sp. DSM 15011]